MIFPTFQNQTLTISLDKPSFFVDEYIQGKVQLNIVSPIIINDINLSLNSYEKWEKGNEFLDKISENCNECLLAMSLDVKKQLNINSNLISLSAGTFIFSFVFRIPKTVQPCFEFPETESNAYIRYYLTAQIASPYVQSTSSTFVLLKSRPNLENKQLSFSNSTNLRKWGLFSAGETCLNVSIENGTDSFKHDATIDLNIDIDNNKGKLATDECKITLKRNIILKAKNGGQVKSEIKEDCINKTVKTVVGIGNKKNFPASISLRDMDISKFDFKNNKLPYTNISDMGYFLPSINSAIIQCNYNIEVILSFESFVKQDDKPKVNIPITICHQSVIEYNAEIQSYYERQNQINTQYNNQYNNQYDNQYDSQYNEQYNDQYNDQYNNQYDNNQYNDQYNNQNTINQCNNNENNEQITDDGNQDLTYQKPLPQEENNIKENNDNDLPSQEELEKTTQNNNDNNNTGDSSDAPAPFFPPNP